MSVCNLYKKLWSEEDNTFYCFTTYSDVLAGVIANDNQVSVTPSRYLLLNLAGLDTDAGQNKLGSMLQNYYDNGTCVLRDNNITIDYCLGGLMNKLVTDGFITDLSSTQFAGGNIDIISTKTIDGCNYSEWTCYVTPDIKRTYKIALGTEYDVIDDQTNIRGYKDSTVTTPYGLTSTANGAKFFKTGISKYAAIDEASFNFNAVLVLMNITIGSKSFYNIPMGICILKNTITKTISDKTIYGQGTTWGLKVAMRFANTKDGTNNMVITDTDNGSFLACIDRLNTAIDTMNTMISKFSDFYDNARTIAWSHEAIK